MSGQFLGQVYRDSQASISVTSFNGQPPDFRAAAAWTSAVLCWGRGARGRTGTSFGGAL